MTKESWYLYPKKSVLITFIALWLIGNFLLILVITDFFTLPFIQRGNFMIYFLMIASTYNVYKILLNYLKNSKVQP